MEYKTFIETALRQASSIAIHHFGTVSASVKQDDNNQVLTLADTEISEFLVRKCSESFPKHNIIDEEAGLIDRSSEYTWVLDPIDGTSNFASALPHFGIMIGLLHDDQPIAGGIALPAFEQIYIAVKGEGATCNGRPIHVSSETVLANALVSYGIDGHPEDPGLTTEETALLAHIVLNIRNLRSTNSAFDFCAVADGRYGAILNKTSKIWDNVAPHILISEAGGVYTDFWGKPIEYDAPLTRVNQNFTVCAATPRLYQQLQDVLSANR